MKKTLAILFALMMAVCLLPTIAFAEGNTIKVGNTADANYATLADAVTEAKSGDTIVLTSNLTMTESARFWDKHLKITSGEGDPYTITRDAIATESDTARGSYNPAMIEVQTLHSSASLTLTNIILDDNGNHAGTVFAQAVSGEEPGDNTVYVQDAIVASNATEDCTITLGKGAVLRNFGGMSAVRVTNKAKLVMESGSVIEDNPVSKRTKGSAAGEVGPAGAVWIQSAAFEMEDGAKIQNVDGRAVYADGGEATIGGTISGITGNSNMWQGEQGVAIHLRNKAECVLKDTGIIKNITSGSAVFCNKSTFNMEQGSAIKDGKTLGIFANDYSTVSIAGQITGLTGGAINLQTYTKGVLLPSSSIDHNSNGTWIIYLNNGATLDIFGKINDNQSEGTAHCAALYVVSNGASAHAILEKGGEICNNTNNGSKYGAAVELQQGECSFTMNGGKITGNKGPLGAIQVHKGSAKLIMNDGEVTGNTSTGSEAGIYIENGNPTAELNGGKAQSITLAKNVSAEIGKGNIYISDRFYLESGYVTMIQDAKSVTPAPGSFDIKLGNASKGWSDPIATFWTQRDGAASLTVGGLKLPENNLPVYVLTQKTGADGKPAPDAPVHTYAATVDADGNVNFTLPSGDMNGNGCAVAIVQPTTDYGTLTISGPDTIQQNTTGADYPVTYTVTYTMSDSMKNIIAQSGSTATYSLTINKDTRLTGTLGTFNGTSIDVTYTLPNGDFTAGESLFASAELTITVGNDKYIVPSNVAETKMIGSGSTGGDSTGGDSTGGGHYHPDPIPFPVIVIPPKTGDMTIWQSILHFFGIR